MRATLDFLSKASLNEVREKYGVAITEAQLQQMRASARTGLSQLAKFGYSFAEFVKWSTGKGLHIVMFPVFFIYFQKQQNSATLMAGMAEWAAFSA